MKKGRVKKIDLSRKRIASLADKFYNEGQFVSALRFACKELETYGGDPDVFARFADIYEAMGLQGSAINSWFRYLDVADEEDLPEIYEGLAANYLGIGNEAQSAFYYNKLVDMDDQLSDEAKMEIAEVFSSPRKEKFQFVYPPHLVDYSKELERGSQALKAGDCRMAVEQFSQVAKGAKEYAAAKEMQAVAHLLAGETEKAEQICKELLETKPDDVRTQATLAAVYLEQGKKEESRALALALAQEKQDNTDDLYKVATVCCENELHEYAYQKFVQLDEKMPYDGRMLYFKAVSAYKSGHLQEAEAALDVLCTVYPDAEVAKYYLRELREYRCAIENGEQAEPPEFIYFYHLPQAEREHRCRTLLKLNECPKDEAQIFGLLALHDGYFHWCFDEMDGGDHDLQYLALMAAVHVRADEFIAEVLLDFEVIDVLKVETVRMLLERNEDAEVGLVLCHLYRRVPLYRIKIGRTRRKKFLEAYAKVTSKFAVVKDSYSEKLARAAETLYRALEKYDALDLINNVDDCSCAIFMLTGLKEMGKDPVKVAAAFDAQLPRVQVLLSYVVSDLSGDKIQENTDEERTNETDRL